MVNVIIAKLAKEEDLASRTLPTFTIYTDAVSYVFMTMMIVIKSMKIIFILIYFDAYFYCDCTFLGKYLCVSRDNDKCLSSSNGWASYKCAHLKKGTKYHKYCNTYSKDTRRCCPEACENTEPFTQDLCDASDTVGICTYPNEAQCCKIYSIVIWD